MKYFSMFSGIGGFELGISNALSKQESKIDENLPDNRCELSQGLLQTRTTICIGYSEIDKYAIKIYEKHFKGHKNYGDCTEIKWSDVENFELLVGGFPCQAFSVAGKRKGFSDTRGTLFFEIARCLEEKHPRLFLLENVKGLLSHDKGNTFLTILTTLDELGYDCQWQVLNSKNFGVPQNRERVFIIGHLRGERRPEVFPIGETDKKIINQYKTPKAIRYPLRFNNRNQKKIEGDYMYCLDGSQTNGLLTQDIRLRRLTPTECERLQGFPYGWTEGISDAQRYKCLGNAVTVNVIREVMKKIF